MSHAGKKTLSVLFMSVQFMDHMDNILQCIRSDPNHLGFTSQRW